MISILYIIIFGVVFLTIYYVLDYKLSKILEKQNKILKKLESGEIPESIIDKIKKIIEDIKNIV